MFTKHFCKLFTKDFTVWRDLHARLFKCQLLFLLEGRKEGEEGRREEGESDVMGGNAEQEDPRRGLSTCIAVTPSETHRGHRGTQKPRGCGEDETQF